jgi:acyl-CoA synthetase (AMP-forming)/AMP-acid ligase II
MKDLSIDPLLPSVPSTIHQLIDGWVKTSPEQNALIDSSGVWTYKDLDAAVTHARNWLTSLSIRPGDRVLLVSENCRPLVAVLLAVTSLDAWPVLVNARLSAREIDNIKVHSGSRRSIFFVGASTHAAEHAARYNAIADAPVLLGPVAVSPLNDAAEPEPVESEPEDRIAALIYTSGSTGLPKGVMLTHRNVLFIACNAAKIRSLTPRDRLYGVMPISHIVGLAPVLLGTLYSGASLYLVRQFDPMSARKAIETDKITVMLGVPAMFNQFAEYAKLRRITRFSFPSLRILSCSGAPLHPATKSSTEDLFGLVLHHGYGVTEASPNIAQTRIESPSSDLSVGPPFPGVEVKLVDGSGNTVPEGEPGELWARGPNIMRGYYRSPEETSTAVNAEGWLNTRDVARIQDGNLYIIGRTRDLIVHKGFNVYPVEVESVLNAHPDVAQSAVIGVTIDQDEEVIAFVQLSAGSSLTVGELAAYAAQHLVMYKRPSKFIVVSSMPTTASGKILKSELVKLLQH